MRCPNCGEQVKNKKGMMNFCGFCGTNLRTGEKSWAASEPASAPRTNSVPATSYSSGYTNTPVPPPAPSPAVNAGQENTFYNPYTAAASQQQNVQPSVSQPQNENANFAKVEPAVQESVSAFGDSFPEFQTTMPDRSYSSTGFQTIKPPVTQDPLQTVAPPSFGTAQIPSAEPEKTVSIPVQPENTVEPVQYEEIRKNPEQLFFNSAPDSSEGDESEQTPVPGKYEPVINVPQKNIEIHSDSSENSITFMQYTRSSKDITDGAPDDISSRYSAYTFGAENNAEPIAVTVPEPAPAVTAPDPVPVTPAVPVPDPVPVAPAVPAPDPVPVVPAMPVPDPVPVAPAMPVPDPVPVAPAVPVPDPVPVAPAMPVPDPVSVAPAMPVPDPVPAAPAVNIRKEEPVSVPEVQIPEPAPVAEPEPVVPKETIINFIGQNKSSVESMLRFKGIVPVFEYVTDENKYDTVISQSIPGGTEVETGTEVKITVSAGTWSEWSENAVPASSMRISESKTQFRRRSRTRTLDKRESATPSGFEDYNLVDTTYKYSNWVTDQYYTSESVPLDNTCEIVTQAIGFKYAGWFNPNSISAISFSTPDVANFFNNNLSISWMYDETISDQNIKPDVKNWRLANDTMTTTPAGDSLTSNIFFSAHVINGKAYAMKFGSAETKWYIYRRRTLEETTYHFEKEIISDWSDWSEWSDQEFTANDDCEVQSRTLSRSRRKNSSELENE